MMSTRPVVSYDDITLPYDQPSEPAASAPSSTFAAAYAPTHAPAPPSQFQPQNLNHAASSSSNAHAHAPPAKKRKKGNNQQRKQYQHQNQHQHGYQQHWDEPPRANNNNSANDAQGSQRAEFLRQMNGPGRPPAHAQTHAQAQSAAKEVVVAEEEVWEEGEGEYGGEGYEYGYEEGEEEEEEEEESRELTHEEIWDDSALVDAWDSAMEEFRRYHGKDTDWKTQPVKKSPLWYNVPVDPSKKKAEPAAAAAASAPTSSAGPVVDVSVNVKEEAAADDDEANSRPINFDTFVPTHDASLHVPAAAEVDYTATSATQGAGVSQDEAFERALSATYWAGYWTAMYHARRGQQPTGESAATKRKAADSTQADEDDDGMDEDEDEETGEAGFVSTQR